MATMIPDVDPRDIPNSGESRVYAALRILPDQYTVCYSLKHRTPQSLSADSNTDFGEADFVIVCPHIGYMVIEVKQGKIEYNAGQWLDHRPDGPEILSKAPLEQARKAMFAIRDTFKVRISSDYVPLTMRYALRFPDSPGISGDLPMDLDMGSVLFEPDLREPELKS